MEMNNPNITQSLKSPSQTPVDDAHQLVKTGTAVSHLFSASSTAFPVAEV